MEDLKKETGKRIRRIRKELKMNLEGLGSELGLAKTTVHQYETGLTTPSLDNLVKIADMGGVSVEYLITGKEPTKKREKLSDDEIISEALVRPGLQDRLFARARDQVREEMAPYDDPIIGEIVKAVRQLPETDRVQLLDNAHYMIHRNESRRNEGGGSGSAERTSA